MPHHAGQRFGWAVELQRGQRRRGIVQNHLHRTPISGIDRAGRIQASEPLPGILFGEMNADQADITGLAPYFFGEFVLSLPLQHQVFIELSPGEFPDRLLDILLRLVQLEVHYASPLSVKWWIPAN